MVSTAANSTPSKLPDCFSFGTPTASTISYANPTDVAVDSSGNLYVDDQGGDIFMIPAPVTSSSTPTTQLAISQQAYEIAYYGGYIYYGALNASSQSELYRSAASQFSSTIPSTAATSSSLATIQSIQTGMTAGPNGEIYINGYAEIQEYNNGYLSTFDTLATGTSLNGVGTDSSGTVYYSGSDSSGAPFVARSGSPVENFASVAVGLSKTGNLPFTIGANGSTTVTSIEVLTEGATGLDFTDAGGSTCTAKTYTTSTHCTVNVKFAPRYAGSRRGAVVFLNGSTVLSTTYVYGTGTGPQVAFGPSAVSTLAGGFSIPAGIAVDAAGNSYVVDNSTNKVFELSPGCSCASCATSLGGGFSGPSGVAVDGAGNIYVADVLNNAVKEIPPGCTSSSCVPTVGGGFNHPSGVAVDGAGNAYAGDFSKNLVYEIPSGCTSALYSAGSCNVTTLASGFTQVDGLALDGAGNLYISPYGETAVSEIARATAPSLTFTTTQENVQSSDSPQTVTVENIGNATLSLVVKVTDSYGNGISGATVSFTAPGSGAGATLSTPAKTGSNGETSVTATANGLVGSYTVTASTSGVGGTASFSLSNTKHAVTPAVTPNATTLAYGQPVTITAAITPSTVQGTVPTGSTTFFDDAKTLSPTATVANAAASYTVSVPTIGSHTYAATYSGDANFQASVQTTGPAVTVNKASSALSGPTSTTVGYDQSGSITIAITGQFSGAGIATPSGSIGYAIYGTAVSGSSPITSGAATIPVPNTLAAGTYTVSITYAGDTNYNAATSISVPLTIAKAGSAVSLVSSTKNANLNASITFTATVTSATSGTPTGGVEFLDGSTVLGSGQLNNSGVATYTTSSLTAGLHQITAVYQGDANFNGATSAALAQIVTAPVFSLMSSTTSLSLKAGQTGKATISMIPVGGFTGGVLFTCSGLPAESRCVFSPSMLTSNGSNTTTTSTLTITTNGPNSGTVALMTHRPKPDGIMMAGLFWLPSLLFSGFLFWQRKKLNAKYRVLLVLLLAATTLSGMVGCGFSQALTGPGTSTVTVTGTSGSSAHAVTLYVKVTQ
jgi:hypothetical protein